ncbi:hypothetical protein HAX54_039608 [Datura stramonium]|uniref:Transducin/WD40 repeat-like superfamily protein n=1 Tax=Datura stramonium TaxID=4076 RepID=A0ABS8VQV1_DATST|nr:hypothetical protein [Datura stramonium]
MMNSGKGRYKLQYEDSSCRASSLCSWQDCSGNLAHLKDKPVQRNPNHHQVLGGGVGSAAARFLGGNGSKTLSFVGGNGGSKSISGMSGRNSGDVYSVSLRQQLQDIGKKLIGAQHYNKDGAVNNSRCTSIHGCPNSDGAFVVAHADGNFYVYDKSKDGSADPSFPVIKDQTQFSVSHARYSKNPIARWHICQGSINSIVISNDGAYIATVGRDGYLRVFDYKNEQPYVVGKATMVLYCAVHGGECVWCFSMDGKYILTGGEDDLVQVWSMEERKVVAWGEGHNSWVSGVAFDSYWSAPNSDGTDGVYLPIWFCWSGYTITSMGSGNG